MRCCASRHHWHGPGRGRPDPRGGRQSIVGTCKVELFDVAKIVRESGRAGSIAIPLVKA
jgi:hypothetical protein